jgi:osmotically-inducible protein OsmY
MWNQRKNMKTLKLYVSVFAVVSIGTLAGCSTATTKAADFSEGIRTTLDQAGLKDVTETQDRTKGVVTLGGHVPLDSDKAKAESIARSIADGQVISNQIAVLPAGAESETKAVNSDLDQGIAKNLDAALLQNRFHESVKYAVKNSVVTLTGNVESQSMRGLAQSIASNVPNVQQVVNELQVKNQKATSSN